jgi:hypothetical protein
VTVDETIEAIERLRAMGAQRVRVADIEVDFGAVPKPVAVAAEPAPRVTPEEAQRRAREDDEKVIFAASG